MAEVIVQSTEIVTLLGAGAVANGALAESLALASTLVAADGGAKTALEAGHIPDAVIGDFDSLDAAVRTALPPDRLHHIAEQDSTDFDKALRNIAAPLVLAVGFTGRRSDHELSVYSAMVRLRGSPVVVLGEEDLCFHLRHDVALDLGAGTRVSLFPMAECRCASTGLRWATDAITFAPWGRVGTSNVSVADRVTLRPMDPGMLVIVPRAHLGAVVSALV